MVNTTVPVFDGHNDTLLRLEMAARSGKPLSFMEGDENLHIDLPKAKQGGFAGGLFAIFIPPVQELGSKPDFQTMVKPVDQTYALELTDAMMARAMLLARESEDQIRICLSSADIRKAMEEGALAIMLHIEGAEAIDADFNALEVLHAAGLRSIGPVWSRSNIFGHGVPFDFPGSPDVGPGLTDLGKELVRRCNAMKIMIDLSHLNEKGFWDVHAITDKPMLATHSNVHALCKSRRNLTDKQLDAIAESKGLVGLNYSISFLRSDGDKSQLDMDIDIMVDHLAYLVEKLGEEGVGLGSDFDGTTVPQRIGNAAGNPLLIERMRARQFGEELIAKIAHENWLSMLERSGI
nr:dipeptidase [uncultured Cohaesibacter sp.]